MPRWCKTNDCIKFGRNDYERTGRIMKSLQFIECMNLHTYLCERCLGTWSTTSQREGEGSCPMCRPLFLTSTFGKIHCHRLYWRSLVKVSFAVLLPHPYRHIRIPVFWFCLDVTPLSSMQIIWKLKCPLLFNISS